MWVSGLSFDPFSHFGLGAGSSRPWPCLTDLACITSHVPRNASISIHRRKRLIGARSSFSETRPCTGGKLDQKWNFKLLLTFSWEPNMAEEALEPLHHMHRNCSLCLRSCLIQTKFQIKQLFLVKQSTENTMSKNSKHLAQLSDHRLRQNFRYFSNFLYQYP